MSNRDLYVETEQKHGLPMAKLLKSLYARLGTRGQVCAYLGVSANTLYVWLLRCGLEQKTVLVDRVLTSEVKS
jgi:hypothetical protein